MNPTEKIDKMIASYDDWRGKSLDQLRKIIISTDKRLTEDWKWDTGVWTFNGMICAISAFKDHTKINFFRGAFLKDSKKLFNNGLNSKRDRSIDFSEKDEIDEEGIKDLLKQSIKLNGK